MSDLQFFPGGHTGQTVCSCNLCLHSKITYSLRFSLSFQLILCVLCRLFHNLFCVCVFLDLLLYHISMHPIQK